MACEHEEVKAGKCVKCGSKVSVSVPEPETMAELIDAIAERVTDKLRRVKLGSESEEKPENLFDKFTKGKGKK